MKSFLRLLTSAVFLLAALPSGAEVDRETWKEINPRLDELVELGDEREELPKSKWFGRDQKDADEEISKLLDEAVAILAGSNATALRGEIEGLTRANSKLKSQISQYKRERLSAPEESLFSTSREGYDRKIEEAETEIRRNENRIEELRGSFAESMESYGLKMEQSQVDLLLNSVLGSDIVESVAVYDNVKQVSMRLAELTAESGEEIEISRRYYAMHVVLLRILHAMQADFIGGIDKVYLPRINGIEEEVEELTDQSKQLLRRADNDAHRAHLRANLESQELTLRTAELYRRHLRDQRDKMEEAYRRTGRDIDVAENTYRTVSASGELVTMIRNTQSSFDALANIQVPELLVFENLQMKEEFAALTERIAR